MAPSYILFAIPFSFLLMGIEWWVARKQSKQVYRLNDSINNLVVGIGNRLFGLVNKGLLIGVAIWIKDHYAIWNIPATWWSFLLALLVFDFLFYWAHRWGHELNIFWGLTQYITKAKSTTYRWHCVNPGFTICWLFPFLW